MTEKPQSNTVTRHLKKDEVLFREGEESDRMYIIQEGVVSVCRMRGLQMIELNQLKKGEILGELSFFDRRPRSATAIALSDVTVTEVPFWGLDKVWDNVPDYLKAIVVAVADRLRHANDTIRLLKPEEDLIAEASPNKAPDEKS